MPERHLDEQQQREPLERFGQAEDELEICIALAAVVGQMLQLRTLNPVEQHEIAHDFHQLRSRLLGRPDLREAAWPRSAETNKE